MNANFPRRRRFAGVAVAAVTALLLPLQAAPHATAKTERFPAAGPALTIEGKGYGHGRGLSQYGAQGAAKSGLSSAEIIEFYYPGTDWGTVSGNVSVQISADNDNELRVRSRSGLKVRDLKAKKVYTLPANGAVEWRLVSTAKGTTALQFRTSTTASFKTWKKMAANAQFGAANKPISLVLPTGKVVQYRGTLRSSIVSGTTRRDTVNVVTMETYLRGVVPLEMPASWHPQAVAAQSVAARTYAAFERRSPMSKNYQICDTTRCQVYGGASAENKLSDAAIKSTAKKIVTYDGKPAFTQFGSSNGGVSAAGSLPYQIQQSDPYDTWTGNPVRSWSTAVPLTQVQKAWPKIGTLTQIAVTRRSGTGEFGGRVEAMTLIGAKSKVQVTGDQFRTALGLRSTYFTIVD
ncbi:SpoIID/LytB domain-containing protein [Nocardioides yefusunii]|uniref:SpoIID/LytB domain-containing protein n=1 Tax=Nocardioides yefusunii TaxID=2500546 RepID=A0ABW1R0M6_9ACTN|nr:SpoIID/LytB domain-containing protein [Nocardioides yefusunii]